MKLKITNDYLIEELINDKNYEIFVDGRIYSVRNKKFLGTINCKEGYKRIKYKNKRLTLHRIVYRKFVGPLDNKMVVNHKDRDVWNNHYTNLELITQQQNIEYKYLDKVA